MKICISNQRRKKLRIPFAVLALVVIFASFCIFSLLQLRPTALAASSLAHSAFDVNPTVTPAGVPESAPWDQSVEFLLTQNNGAGRLGSGLSDNDCHDHHKFRLAKPLDDAKDTFCWNQDDFTWADRDVTCIYNDLHGPQVSGSDWVGPAWDVNMVDKNDTKLNIHLDAVPLNQNTCTDNSVCVSNNASGNDSAGSGGIHDQVGGDNILCGNQGCIDGKHTSIECGNPSGKQREYDRFACQMTSDTTSTLEDANWKSPSVGQTSAFFNEKRWWWSTGIAINPSAYDPNDALYLPMANLRAADIEPSGNTPECNADHHWACKNNANIIIYQYNGSLTLSSDSNHAGFYEEAIPHYTPAQFKEDDPTKVTQSAWDPGSAYVPVYWVVCSAEGGWAFPCSDPTSSLNMPFITTEDKSQSLSGNHVAEGIIDKDWLSGDADYSADSHPITQDPNTSQQAVLQHWEPGHLTYTYLNDTVNQPGIQTLKPFSMALGSLLIMPVLILIGYQFIWASWTLGRANAMEAFGRIILSVSAMAISYELAAMLISLANMFNVAVVNFHMQHSYQPITIGNQDTTFSLTNQGETTSANPRALESFRGIVIPITRWGCVANDFISIVANKFWTDAAGLIPFIGGLGKFIGNIFNAVDVAKHAGEFLMLILTITLCTQVFMRVLLLNYYILTGPLAFGCWGLPGGVGQKVVSSWTKGFVSLLFAQTAQLFVLATFPLILPPFPTFPTDRFGILDVLFQAIPRILVLSATIKVPTVMGTGATKAIAQAGTVVGGAVAAAGAAALQVV